MSADQGVVDRRAFPVIHTAGVSAVARFYERLGFTRQIQYPATGEPSFVGLRRGATEIGVAEAALRARGTDARGPVEMFVFVAEVDSVVERLRGDGVPVLSEPADMPWGERVAYISDPDGNWVAVASAQES